MRRDAATERQVQAADPGQSTWLSANAGSGKTRVLTDRVARLLLGGVDPQHILCLTYTKAAASEMQNRLFRRLGEWAMLGDAELRERLTALGEEGPGKGEHLRRARRLFARAIETPGGLKIQTIHSFCAGLLRRFPLEAGVSPQFAEMDERAVRLLARELLEEMADGPDTAAFDGVAAQFTGDSLERFTEEVTKHRAAFADAPDAAGIRHAYGLAPGTGAADIVAAAFTGSEAALMTRVLPVLRNGSVNDVKAADRLAAVNLTTPGLSELAALEGVFLTGAGTKSPFSAKTGSFPTKQTRESLAAQMPELDALMERVERARAARVALAGAERTLALHRFAAAFLPRYAERKLQRGWLDFDDLILKARALLTDPGLAEWVLYRIDGGIDHILVDEAQDTSPVQWQVIDLLTREFTAGAGARDDVGRTMFVVGDKKQSIYSFQGADPARFDEMRAEFALRLEGAARPMQITKLEYSFRSSPAILGSVDMTFQTAVRQGVGDDLLHRAFHDDMPGRVDLWPVIEKSTEPESPDWSDPVDVISTTHHNVQLASRIAAEIGRMIGRETLWEKRDGEARWRRVRAGDFLILVQRRSPLFHEIIRACKAAGLPVAGADRLKIGGELAVRDLTALLAFLALPEDSLSLAAALRSPLFGWSEAAIFDLAAGREERHLWRTLSNQRSAHAETVSVLRSLRDDADFLRPYDLIERILTRHDGRRKLIARLGEEAEDGIDALLAQALAYERMEVPSLTGFLIWLESDEIEIKRQPDSAGDRIRVMTVHGAKGLESPIVILPDTGRRKPPFRDEILTAPDGMPLWKTPVGDSAPLVEEAREAAMRVQEQERQRLLYVAMTRAEQWLITCAAGDLGKDESWYNQIAQGMQAAGAAEHAFPFGSGLRLQVGDRPEAESAQTERVPKETVALPDWALRSATAPERPVAPLSPSDLGGDKALSGGEEAEDTEAARRRGVRLHLLLEHLPTRDRCDWPALARQLLAGGEDGATDDEIADLLAEAQRVLTAPVLAEVLALPALTEVALTAAPPALGGVRVAGTVDRLIVGEGRVLAIDYKSNAVVPDRAGDVPEGILRQMGAYAAALAQIYPDHAIETSILWTRSATIMPLPSQLVAAALARASTS